MKISFAVLVTLLALAAAACGAASEPSEPEAPAAEPAPTPPKPSGPPPELDGVEGPPPAWVETRDGALWLAYSGFCWETTCADYEAPTCDNPRIPELVLESGDEIRFHLGYEPKEVVVSFFRQWGAATTNEAQLASERAPTWAVDRPGPFALHATSLERGDASYAGCIRFRGGGASTGTPAAGGLSVDEALASSSDEPLLVQGALFAVHGRVFLCSGFAESYPPQCAGPKLVVKGLDGASVKRLRRVGPIRWSDDPVQLLGTVEEDVFTVSEATIP